MSHVKHATVTASVVFPDISKHNSGSDRSTTDCINVSLSLAEGLFEYDMARLSFEDIPLHNDKPLLFGKIACTMSKRTRPGYFDGTW